MIDRIVTYADPITTAIIIFIVALWVWSRLKAWDQQHGCKRRGTNRLPARARNPSPRIPPPLWHLRHCFGAPAGAVSLLVRASYPWRSVRYCCAACNGAGSNLPALSFSCLERIAEANRHLNAAFQSLAACPRTRALLCAPVRTCYEPSAALDRRYF